MIVASEYVWRANTYSSDAFFTIWMAILHLLVLVAEGLLPISIHPFATFLCSDQPVIFLRRIWHHRQTPCLCPIHIIHIMHHLMRQFPPKIHLCTRQSTKNLIARNAFTSVIDMINDRTQNVQLVVRQVSSSESPCIVPHSCLLLLWKSIASR